MRLRPATLSLRDRSLERPARARVANRPLLLGATLVMATVGLVVCVPEQLVAAIESAGAADHASTRSGRGTSALTPGGVDSLATGRGRPLAAELSDSSALDVASSREADPPRPTRVAPSSAGLPGDDSDESTGSSPGFGGTTFGFDFFAHIGESEGSRQGDGPYVGRHPDGSVAVEGAYENGEREGPWAGYYPDGSLRLEGQYADGKRLGRWKAYHPSGQLMGEGEYNNGLREGTWVLYYSNGLVKEHGVFEHDLRHGPWQYYDNFGQLEPRSGFYRYGRLL